MDDDPRWGLGIICVHTVYKIEYLWKYQSFFFKDNIWVNNRGIFGEKEPRVLSMGVEPTTFWLVFGCYSKSC